MNLRRLFGTVSLCLLITTVPAQAAYLSDHDVTLELNLAPSLLSFSGETGQETFELQEEVHESLTSTTGQEVDHYYIWVKVNGAPILAVDPFWASGRQPGGN